MKFNKKKLLIKIDKSFFLKIIDKNDITKEYINWMNDYDVVKYTQQKHIIHNKKNVTDFVENKFISVNDFLFGIFFKKKHIGNIKLGPVKWLKKSSEISFIIGKKNLWGQGIGYTSTLKVMEFALNKIGIVEITATYYNDNIGSAKIFNKCGFSLVKKVNNLTLVKYKLKID